MGNICSESPSAVQAEKKSEVKPFQVQSHADLVEISTVSPTSVKDQKSPESPKTMAEAISSALEAVAESAEAVVEEMKEAVTGIPEAKESTTPADSAKEVDAADEVVGPDAAPPKVVPVTITFQQASKTLEVQFEKQNLGFHYRAQHKGSCCTGQKPTGKFVVAKVDAKNLALKDLKVGMLITKVNGKEIPANTDYNAFHALVTTAAKDLPEA